MSLTNKEAIEKLCKNLVKFLTDLNLSKELSDKFKQIEELSFAEKMYFIDNYLKPNQMDLKKYIEEIMDEFSITRYDFEDKDIETLRRYLLALIIAAQ